MGVTGITPPGIGKRPVTLPFYSIPCKRNFSGPYPVGQAVDKLSFFVSGFFAVGSGLIKQYSRTSRKVRSARLNNWTNDNAIFASIDHVLPQRRVSNADRELG